MSINEIDITIDEHSKEFTFECSDVTDFTVSAKNNLLQVTVRMSGNRFSQVERSLFGVEENAGRS